MGHYLWVFVLTGVALLSLVIFLMSFGKDHFLIKKLKLKKSNYLLNGLLLAITLSDVGLIIYLFMTLKDQIDVLS